MQALSTLTPITARLRAAPDHLVCVMEEPDIAMVDLVLAPWREVLGEDWTAYRNHVMRTLHFCLAISPCGVIERQKLEIAGCFHDIGLWTHHTLDYLEPSVLPARAFLAEKGLEDWSEEVALMITEHHKLRPFKDRRYPLVELFRKGDLVDVSWGAVRFGIPRDTIHMVQRRFPNHGFHRMLARRAGAWFLRHPLRPAPMMKW